MVERNFRRGSRWLEMIHTKEVTSLAKRHDISLDDNLIRFLEEYSEVVLHVTSKQRERKTSQALLQQELEDVTKVVQDEVNAIREALFPNNEEAKQYFFAVQHQETYLPIVHLAIRGLPELIVHVTRTYATRRKGTSFGLLSKSTGGALWGATARAANYLRRRCRDQHWDLSVSEVVNIWYQQAFEIPPEERMRPEQNPSSMAGRYKPIRRRARMEGEMRASKTTTRSEGKERNTMRDLAGIESINISKDLPSKKQRRADVSEVSEMQNTSGNTPQNGGRRRETGGASREDKSEKRNVPKSQDADVSVARHGSLPSRSVTTVEELCSDRKENSMGSSKLESRFKSDGEKTTEAKAIQDVSTADDTGNGRLTQTKSKLAASTFLISTSQTRHSGQDGDFKRVDIDEGFDTIGGVGDYDSEESGYESGDHDGRHALHAQQLRFEQVDVDSMNNTGDGDNDGEIVEVGKAGDMDGLHSSAKKQKFASYKFADAVSAVNLAGNDGATNYVKHEEEEHRM